LKDDEPGNFGEGVDNHHGKRENFLTVKKNNNSRGAEQAGSIAEQACT
jgi:hypothetical protein